MDSIQTALLVRILTKAEKLQASDLHFTQGMQPMVRVDGLLLPLSDESMQTSVAIEEIVRGIFSSDQLALLESHKSLISVYEFEGKLRVKIHAYYQEGVLSLSLRFLDVHVKTLRDLHIPSGVSGFHNASRGLLLIAGNYGSGRTTLAAAILEEINRTRAVHIMTLEDPIEYNLVGNMSIIDQREVGRDTPSFFQGLEDAKKEDVDVVFLGEMRDASVVKSALELAAGGTLVVAIMDSTSIPHVLDKLLGVFSVEEQAGITALLTDALRGVVITNLLPKIGGGLIPVHELLLATSSIKSLISSRRFAQIPSIIQTSRDEGMMSMDFQLANLVRTHEVSIEHARNAAINSETFESLVRS